MDKDNRTPSKKFEDDMVEFYTKINYLEDLMKREAFINELREKYKIEVSALVNVQ